MPARIDTEQNNNDRGSSVLKKLNQPHFDPVDFLNEILPTITLSSQTQTQKTSRSTQLQGASTDSLALLSTLNALNVRASADLTSLTDEIIRSGNRLAYEVEVLRGDVNSFNELLTESLHDDIRHFVQTTLIRGATADSSAERDGSVVGDTLAWTNEPDFMTQLRLLGKVKARLEAVITTFGEAMKWPMPPSEISMASSLISVSAPELGIQNTAEDDEARETLKVIRAEINDLLGPETRGHEGLEAASQRVEEYRQLAMLWKGTGEERARLKFVDTLTKIVEDRKKVLDGRAARNAKGDASDRSSSAAGRTQKGLSETGGAAGLFRNLQRLKDDLYLE